VADFETHLKEYRDRISKGGLQNLKESLASGAIANDAKVRAVNFAIKEAEEKAKEEAAHAAKKKDIRFVPAWLQSAWHDPVGSKVIGGIILYVLGSIVAGILILAHYVINSTDDYSKSDALFQSDQEICTVIGSELKPTIHPKKVLFKSIRCEKLPNFNESISYRAFTIKNCKYKVYSALDIADGEKPMPAYGNVTCDIQQ
jgi:hypothetical protein